MTADIKKGKAGMLFEDFLKELGICEETIKRAVKRVLEFLTAQEEIKKCPTSLKRYLDLQVSRIHTR